MKRHKIESSLLRGVGYDPTTGILEVEYRNGTLCCWLAVPAKVYQGLCAAPDVDVFFRLNIKNSFLFQFISPR